MTTSNNDNDTDASNTDSESAEISPQEGGFPASNPGGESGKPPSGNHANPIDVKDVTDAERGEMLREYLEAFAAEFGTDPRLMPLDDEGKAPAIVDRCTINSSQARRLLVNGEEAIRRISEEGARGFAIYAGRPSHHTEDLVLVDVDDRETFPYEAFPDTLTVLSGSGRGEHFTYRNAGDVENAKGKGDVDGEIRAENWYCVSPGSIHPSGGVYHVTENRSVAELADDDLPDSLRPGSRRRRHEEKQLPDPPESDPADLDDETLEARLERAFENPHDGDRLRKVYNGRYAAAGSDDRSSAEFWLACRLDQWVGLGDRAVVEDLLERANLQKWAERPDRSFRDSILEKVGYQDWYYDPDEPDQTPYGEHVSALPLAQLDALDSQEARRYARKRGVDWPSTEEARDRLDEWFKDTMRDADDRVGGAPTALGKSHDVATASWLDHPDVTGEQPVVHLSKTRDARNEAIAASDDAGVSHEVVRSRHEACSLAGGAHDPAEDEEEDPEVVITMDGAPASEWLDAKCDPEGGAGIPFSVAHAHLAEHNDQGIDPPCCAEEGDECEAIAQWDGVPRTEEGDPAADVIHATHPFAHVPGLRLGSNVAVDEQPDFTVDLSTDRVQRAVTAFLRAVDAPVTTWEAFVQHAQYDGHGDAVARELHAERRRTRRALERTPSREWYFQNPDAHTLAPGLAKAIWYALEDDPDRNGRRGALVNHEPPRLDAGAHDDSGWNLSWVTVVLDDANRVETVRDVPNFSAARCVIGLDAHPTPELWARNTHPGITVDPVLDPEERALWRRYERGLTVVQVGDNTRPAGRNGKYLKNGAAKRRVVIEHLREEFGEDFRTAITAKAAKGHLRDCMDEAGIDDPTILHFGDEESKNDFDGEPAGLIDGCIDPGDDYVLNLLTECGLDAEPERSEKECEDCDGDGCEECDGTGQMRAHGRGFVGPDADAAARLLASVRERHVAQAAGRYARSPDDPDDSAIVFVWTDATPTGGVDLQVPGVTWAATETQEEIVTVLQQRGSTPAREIAEEVGASKQHVSDTLERYEAAGVVDRRAGAGDHGADLYRELAGGTTAGEWNPGVEQITNSHVEDPHTWSLAIRAGFAGGAPEPRTTDLPPSTASGGQLKIGAYIGGDRPPDDPV